MGPLWTVEKRDPDENVGVSVGGIPVQKRGNLIRDEKRPSKGGPGTPWQEQRKVGLGPVFKVLKVMKSQRGKRRQQCPKGKIRTGPNSKKKLAVAKKRKPVTFEKKKAYNNGTSERRAQL